MFDPAELQEHELPAGETVRSLGADARSTIRRLAGL
jgi:hypothetical protein